MLGDAAFRHALHAFMDRWHGKHPIPWDFFNTFNDVTGPEPRTGSGTTGTSATATSISRSRGVTKRGERLHGRRSTTSAACRRRSISSCSYADGTSETRPPDAGDLEGQPAGTRPSRCRRRRRCSVDRCGDAASGWTPTRRTTAGRSRQQSPGAGLAQLHQRGRRGERPAMTPSPMLTMRPRTTTTPIST